jgi:hypothetical protein
MGIWVVNKKFGATIVAELVPTFEAEEIESSTFAIGPADTTLDVDNNIVDGNRRQPNLILVLVLIFTQYEISFLCIDFCQDVIYPLLLDFIKEPLEQPILSLFAVLLELPIFKKFDRFIN